MIAAALLKKICKPRPAWSRKGDHGRLLVVGGSSLYSGSPMLSALAAYRSGCDLVKIATTEKAAYSMRAYSPVIIAYPLRGEFLESRHTKEIIGMQRSVDAMVIGGGLGRNAGTMKFARSIIKKTKIPAVIDADAIHAVRGKLSKNFAVTPHSHEFQVLSGKKIGAAVNQRVAAAKNLAARLDCTILLKGHVDVVSDGKRTELNATGNPSMAKGGFGDTLAGICGALLARGAAPFDAACAAAFINGRAGDLAAKKFGEGIVASDLIDEIPAAIRT